MTRILITGASGFIGAECVRAFAAGVFQPVSAGRRPVSGVEHVAWSLGEPLPVDLAGFDAVLHLACATLSAGAAEQAAYELDLRAAQVLIDQARAVRRAGRPGLKFIFVSSQSASPAAETAYGRSKFAIEAMLTDPLECAVRPGLVFGSGQSGVFALLNRLARALPVTLALSQSRSIQPIHVSDLARALVAITTAADARKVWMLGDPAPMSFAECCAALRRNGGLSRPLTIPFPLPVLRFGTRIMDAALRLRPPLTARVNGLVCLQPMHTAADLAALRIALRPIAPRRHTMRRIRLEEARALLFSISGAADRGSIMAFARHLESASASPVLPAVARRWPAIIRFIEPVNSGAPLRQASLFALAIAEASRSGVVNFVHPAPMSRIRALAGLAAMAFIEAILLPLRLVQGRRRPGPP